MEPKLWQNFKHLFLTVMVYFRALLFKQRLPYENTYKIYFNEPILSHGFKL